MARKKSHPNPSPIPVSIPVESEERKLQRLDEEFWKGFEQANSKYWSVCTTAWRKYAAALEADLLENSKRQVRMPYDDQYDKEIKAAVDEWNAYFIAS